MFFEEILDFVQFEVEYISRPTLLSIFDVIMKLENKFRLNYFQVCRGDYSANKSHSMALNTFIKQYNMKVKDRVLGAPPQGTRYTERIKLHIKTLSGATATHVCTHDIHTTATETHNYENAYLLQVH